MKIFNPAVPFSGPMANPARPDTLPYDRAAAAACIPGMPALRALIDRIGDDSRLVSFGAAAYRPEALRRVEGALQALSAGNHKVSMLLAEPRAHCGLAYRSALPMCTQSTVKAIYAGALIERHPEALTENGQYLHDAVAYSDNAAYERLRQIYGPGPIRDWCLEVGVDAGFAAPDYPRTYTARDMMKLWTRMYVFLNARDSENFGAYLAHSRASAAGEGLGLRYPVQAKAGWEHGLSEDQPYDPALPIPACFTDGDPANDECAINDTGVVYTPHGPFLFVIYTDHPFGIFPNYTTPNPLHGLEAALCAAVEERD